MWKPFGIVTPSTTGMAVTRERMNISNREGSRLGSRRTLSHAPEPKNFVAEGRVSKTDHSYGAARFLEGIDE
jgi:hypothetical protein